LALFLSALKHKYAKKQSWKCTLLKITLAAFYFSIISSASSFLKYTFKI